MHFGYYMGLLSVNSFSHPLDLMPHGTALLSHLVVVECQLIRDIIEHLSLEPATIGIPTYAVHQYQAWLLLVLIFD